MTWVRAWMKRHDCVSAGVQAQAAHEQHRSRCSAAAGVQATLLALERLATRMPTGGHHDRPVIIRAVRGI